MVDKKQLKKYMPQIASFFKFCAVFISIGGGIVAFSKLVSNNDLINFIGIVGLMWILYDYIFTNKFNLSAVKE